MCIGLQHGADPNIANKDKVTPLFIACLNGYDVCVSVLLNHGADPSIVVKNNIKPLYASCQNGHHKCGLLVLLQAGALVDSQSIHGATPSYVASGIGHLKCIVMLVEHGADVNNCTTNDSTPLMAAALK